jgi:hypothetical protein
MSVGENTNSLTMRYKKPVEEPKKPDLFPTFGNTAINCVSFRKGDKVAVGVPGGVARKEMPDDGCVYTDRDGREMIVFDSFFSDEDTEGVA